MSLNKLKALSLLGFSAAFLSLPLHAAVFINEIHYDDATAAGDVGERIEIVATAGEDLSTYSVQLYNGSTPSAAVVYDNDPVPSGSDVTCGGTVRIAVLAYATNGLQNGANDAIALVNSSGAVVQFISYEGVATASSGPAAGTSSINIPVAESSSTLAGTSLQLGGTGAAYADFTWNASAADTFGACNNNQTFTTSGGVNTPPSIVSTSPANAGNTPANTRNFSVVFSENVTAQDAAFSLQCSVTGNIPLSFSTTLLSRTPAKRGRKAAATGSSITLNSTVDMQVGETCNFNINATGIADSQGANLTQNTVVTFNVVAIPNTPPSVVSTIPGNNAVGVPAATDIRVAFNEKTHADAEAFILSCSASGLIPLSFKNKMLELTPTGGRAITLRTFTALQAGETCTLTVLASGITDDDNATMAQDAVRRFTIAGGSVSSYYNRVNTSSAEQLRCSLHQVIRGHTAYPYSGSGTTSTWDILEIADEDPNDPSKILDVYRNRSYTKVSSRAGTGTGLTYNREHTWPNSLGFGSTTGNLGLPNAPYTDTHMLYLSDTNYNSDRSNSPYANCTLASGCAERATETNNGNGGGSGVYPGNSNWFNANAFQTWSKRKGDVARAVMYMAIRYEGGQHPTTNQNEPDLELTDNASLIVGTSSSPAYMGLLTDLLQWHQADPPDAAEIARNEVIFNFQGNRNPFINHPEWASAALFGSTKPSSCSLNPAASVTSKRKAPTPAPYRHLQR
jgi:endonuclease I